MAKIPATIITGFLGAGKTSLIRHLLANADGQRLALIINEFGDIGVDRDLIEGCGIGGCDEDDIVELTNGCICCTVADEFLPTIAALIERDNPPDHIVIETSGLALPKPLVKAFNWPEIRSRVTVDGVVAVIDGAAYAEGRFADDPAAVEAARREDPMLDHESPLAELFADQLACADMVVLNKSDLLADAVSTAAEIKSWLPPAVKLVAATEGHINPRVVLGLDAAAEDDLDARPSHHDGDDDHDHDDFDSASFEIGEIADPADLVKRLAAAIAIQDILRVKGTVAVAGKEMRLVVQAVGGRIQHYYDRPWRAEETRAGRLVVIAAAGFDAGAVGVILAAR